MSPPPRQDMQAAPVLDGLPDPAAIPKCRQLQAGLVPCHHPAGEHQEKAGTGASVFESRRGDAHGSAGRIGPCGGEGAGQAAAQGRNSSIACSQAKEHPPGLQLMLLNKHHRVQRGLVGVRVPGEGAEPLHPR